MRTLVAATFVATAATLVLAVPPSHAGVPGRAVPPTCEGLRATIVGTPGADRLVGTRRPDVIVGRGGDDVIIGLGGDDRLSGGAGNDQVNLFGEADGLRARGGPGDDRFKVYTSSDIEVSGDSGRDQLEVIAYSDTADQWLSIDYRVGEITSTVYDAVVSVVGIEATDVRAPTLTETLGVSFHGTPGHDRITVRSESVLPLVASGYAGNDRFEGTDGDDELDGGPGTDRADGEGGHDTCVSIEQAASCESTG